MRHRLGRNGIDPSPGNYHYSAPSIRQEVCYAVLNYRKFYLPWNFRDYGTRYPSVNEALHNRECDYANDAIVRSGDDTRPPRSVSQAYAQVRTIRDHCAMRDVTHDFRGV